MSTNPFQAFEPQPHPLKTFFNEKGISQATLAYYCGISKNYLNEILNGARPSSDAIESKLADAAKELGWKGEG